MVTVTRENILRIFFIVCLILSFSLFNVIIAAERTVLDEQYIGETFEEEGTYAGFTVDLQQDLAENVSSNANSEEIEPDAIAETAITEAYVESELDRNTRAVHDFLQGDSDTMNLYLDYSIVASNIPEDVDSDTRTEITENIPDQVDLDDEIADEEQLGVIRAFVSRFTLFQIGLPVGTLAIVWLISAQTTSHRETLGIVGIAAFFTGAIFVPFSWLVQQFIHLLFIIRTDAFGSVDPSNITDGVVSVLQGSLTLLMIQSGAFLFAGSVLFAFGREADKRVYSRNSGEQINGAPSNGGDSGEEQDETPTVDNSDASSSDDSGAEADGSDDHRRVTTDTSTSKSSDGSETGVSNPRSTATKSQLSFRPDGVRNTTYFDSRGPLSIYRASHDDVDGRVNLLTFEPDVDVTESVAAEFRKTVQGWINVNSHPNVVSVVEWDDSPQPWVVTEIPEGRPVAERLSELSPAATVDVITDAGEAIRNADLYNTGHYNLSPAYIWAVEDDGTWRSSVDDWGLERRTTTDEMVTPYTAPEQIDENETVLNQQTDIYGLGAVAYHALTGIPPVEASTEAIQQNNIDPPSTHTDVPEAFDDAILTALSADPAERHDSLYDFSLSFEQSL